MAGAFPESIGRVKKTAARNDTTVAEFQWLDCRARESFPWYRILTLTACLSTAAFITERLARMLLAPKLSATARHIMDRRNGTRNWNKAEETTRQESTQKKKEKNKSNYSPHNARYHPASSAGIGASYGA